MVGAHSTRYARSGCRSWSDRQLAHVVHTAGVLVVCWLHGLKPLMKRQALRRSWGSDPLKTLALGCARGTVLRALEGSKAGELRRRGRGVDRVGRVFALGARWGVVDGRVCIA